MTVSPPGEIFPRESILKSRAFNSINRRNGTSMKNNTRAIKITEKVVFKGDIDRSLFILLFTLFTPGPP